MFRARKEHEERGKKSRKDESDVVDAAEPQAKKAKAMTAAQRKEEGKRLAALAVEALAKKEKLAEFGAMFGDKKEEVKRREESADGVGTTPARATSLPLSYEPYPIDTNVPNRHVRTRMIRSYPHGTIVPYGYVRTVGVRPYSNGTIVLV